MPTQFSRLYLQAFERERKISEMQKAAEQADMELALRTAGAKRDSDQNQAAPSAHNRLYSQGILSIMRNDNLHAKRVSEMEMDDLSECTFRPLISDHAKSLNRKNGWAAGMRVDRLTVANMERIRSNQEARETQECVFKPKISDRSKELAEDRNMRMSFGIGNPVLGTRSSIHEALFLDAEKRRIEAETRQITLARERDIVASAPDIGHNAHRPQRRRRSEPLLTVW